MGKRTPYCYLERFKISTHLLNRLGWHLINLFFPLVICIGFSFCSDKTDVPSQQATPEEETRVSLDSFNNPYLAADCERTNRDNSEAALYTIMDSAIYRFAYSDKGNCDPLDRFRSTPILENPVDLHFDPETGELLILNLGNSTLVQYQRYDEKYFQYIQTLVSFSGGYLKPSKILSDPINDRLFLYDEQNNLLMIYDRSRFINDESLPLTTIENINGSLCFNTDTGEITALHSQGLDFYDNEGNSAEWTKNTIEHSFNRPRFLRYAFDTQSYWFVDNNNDEEQLIHLKLSSDQQQISVNRYSLKNHGIAGIANLFYLGSHLLSLYYTQPQIGLKTLRIQNTSSIEPIQNQSFSDRWNGQLHCFSNIADPQSLHCFRTHWTNNTIAYLGQGNLQNELSTVGSTDYWLNQASDIVIDSENKMIYVITREAVIHCLSLEDPTNVLGSIYGYAMANPYHLELDKQNQLLFVLNKPLSKTAYITSYRTSPMGMQREVYHWEGNNTGFLHDLLRDIEINSDRKELYVAVNDNTIAAYSYDTRLYSRQNSQPIRTLHGEDTLLYHPIAIAYDQEQQMLWILNHPPGRYYITIYPVDAQDNTPPTRFIPSSPALSGSYEMIINKNDVLISNYEYNCIMFFDRTSNDFITSLRTVGSQSYPFIGHFQIGVE